MDGFLAKPIELALLDSTIRRLLPRAITLRRRRGLAEAAALAVASLPVRPEVSALASPTLAVLDLGPMLQIFGEISDEVRELLALFIDSTLPLIDDLERAVAVGDAVAAREAAHSAKGAGNSAGAFAFAQLCAEAEAACARSELDAAAVSLPQIRRAFVAVAEAVAVI